MDCHTSCMYIHIMYMFSIKYYYYAYMNMFMYTLASARQCTCTAETSIPGLTLLSVEEHSEQGHCRGESSKHILIVGDWK